MELFGHNPNMIGWTAQLFLPISFVFAKISKKQIENFFWWSIFFVITLMIICTFSRAAMMGMLITFLLFIIFFKNKHISFSVLPFIIVGAVLYFIWNEAVNLNVMDAGRSLSYSGLSPEFFKRWEMIKTGSMIAFNDQAYNSNVQGGFHSLYIKAWLDYGLIFLLFIIFLLFYPIKLSYSISKLSKDEDIRLISISILITFIGSAFQALFGITLFSAKYLQFFFILSGYLLILNRDQFSYTFR